MNGFNVDSLKTNVYFGVFRLAFCRVSTSGLLLHLQVGTMWSGVQRMPGRRIKIFINEFQNVGARAQQSLVARRDAGIEGEKRSGFLKTFRTEDITRLLKTWSRIRCVLRQLNKTNGYRKKQP